jgi:hypothetical protein
MFCGLTKGDLFAEERLHSVNRVFQSLFAKSATGIAVVPEIAARCCEEKPSWQ